MENNLSVVKLKLNLVAQWNLSVINVKWLIIPTEKVRVHCIVIQAIVFKLVLFWKLQKVFLYLDSTTVYLYTSALVTLKFNWSPSSIRCRRAQSVHELNWSLSLVPKFNRIQSKIFFLKLTSAPLSFFFLVYSSSLPCFMLCFQFREEMNYKKFILATSVDNMRNENQRKTFPSVDRPIPAPSKYIKIISLGLVSKRTQTYIIYRSYIELRKKCGTKGKTERILKGSLYRNFVKQKIVASTYVVVYNRRWTGQPKMNWWRQWPKNYFK